MCEWLGICRWVCHWVSFFRLCFFAMWGKLIIFSDMGFDCLQLLPFPLCNHLGYIEQLDCSINEQFILVLFLIERVLKFIDFQMAFVCRKRWQDSILTRAQCAEINAEWILHLWFKGSRSEWMEEGVRHCQLCHSSGKIEASTSASSAAVKRFVRKQVNCVMVVVSVSEICRSLMAGDFRPLQATRELFHAPSINSTCSKSNF